jgi:UDP-N-acetylglucosamine 2-epimerase
MRSVTERPEAVECGSAKLVGADRQAISENVSRLLTDNIAYAGMAQPRFPFGNGTAAKQIAHSLASWPIPRG